MSDFMPEKDLVKMMLDGKPMSEVFKNRPDLERKVISNSFLDMSANMGRNMSEAMASKGLSASTVAAAMQRIVASSPKPIPEVTLQDVLKNVAAIQARRPATPGFIVDEGAEIPDALKEQIKQITLRDERRQALSAGLRRSSPLALMSDDVVDTLRIANYKPQKNEKTKPQIKPVPNPLEESNTRMVDFDDN